MTVQLREPCTRSLRHLLKPWPAFISTTRNKPQHTFIFQGKRQQNFQWSFLSRSYSTTTTTLRVVPQVSVDIEASLSKTKVVKSKKRAYRLWIQYQKTFLNQKETLDIKLYDVLMTALLDKACHGKKTGFWARIIQAYEESRTLNIEPSPTMYMAAIKAYGVSRDTANVTLIFKEFKKRYMLNPTSYGLYMTALIDCGQLPMAYRTFREMNHNSNISKLQMSEHLASFITLCVKRDTMSLGLEAMASFNISDLDKESLERITQSLWNGYSPSTITPLSVESFVSMYIEKSTKIDTLYLFTLFDLLCHHDHFTPTDRTFQLLLKDQIKHDHFGRVISILSSMERLNIEPNSNTMNILIDAFGSQENNVYHSFINVIKTQIDSKSILEGFIKRGDTKAMDWLRDIRCDDLGCYAMVMEYWLTLGKWNDCILEYDRLKLELPQVVTNRRIVKAVLTARFSNGQDWTLCGRELNKRKITFTPTTVSRILNTMIILETKSGQPLVPGHHIITALQLMEKKLNIQLSAEDISRVITGLGKRGDVENGFRLYTWIREQSSERCASSSIYRGMMTSATKNNDIRKLERVWVDMQYRKRFLNQECQLESKEQHTLTRYNILLNGYASRLPKPDLTRVKKVFQRLLAQNLSPDIVTYNILIKSFVNANNMEAANQIFHRMIESGIQPDTYSTNTILNGWIIRKDWNHVENFVKELKSSTCSNLDIVTFNLLVQSFLQLDSKSMNYMHLLKNQNKGTHLKQLQESSLHRDTVKMSSKKIWTIFESTTGYNQTNLKLTQPNAFVKLFSTQADQVTCKLFMKAFVNIKDYTSASKIHKWMTLIPNNKNL